MKPRAFLNGQPMSLAVDELIRGHRRLALGRLAMAIPLYLLFSGLRWLLVPPAGLAFAGLKVVERLSPGSGGAFPSWVAKLLALMYVASALPSEAAARWRETIKGFRQQWDALRLRAALSSPNGFILFLRDFDPEDSNVYDWHLLRGTVVNYTHRDEYLFAGVDESSLPCPVLAIGNPREGASSNKLFSCLWVSGASWQRVVSQLMQAARMIILVVPLSGHLGQLSSVRDRESARASMREFWRMHELGFERRAGLATEAELVLADESLARKTLVVNAFMDGEPSVTSSWRRLDLFQEVEVDHVAGVIAQICSAGASGAKGGGSVR